MFVYLNDAYSKPEQLLLTLYQVGAMAQSNLTTVLGWDEKRTSKVITSLNGGGKQNRKDGLKKVSEIREYSGKRNSGKIRFLSRAGLEQATSLTGQTDALLPLKDGEAKSAANLTKFAVEFATHHPFALYHGPYLAKTRFSLDDLRSELSTCLETEDYVLWLIWIHEAMAAATIRNRLDDWRFILSKASKLDPAHSHHVAAVCSTADVVERVLDQAKRVKSFPLHVTMLGKVDEVVIERYPPLTR